MGSCMIITWLYQTPHSEHLVTTYTYSRRLASKLKNLLKQQGIPYATVVVEGFNLSVIGRLPLTDPGMEKAKRDIGWYD